MKSSMKTIGTFLGAFLALALLATACGGDSASPGDQEVIDAIAQQIRAEGDLPASVDADCMGKAFVDSFGGADNMASEFGLSAQEIIDGKDVDDIVVSQDRAITLADNMMPCGMMAGLASEFTGSGLAEDDADCLLNELDEEAIRDLFASEFMGAEGSALGASAEERMLSSMFGAIGNCEINPADLDF